MTDELERGRVLIQQANFDEAERHFKRLADLSPKNPQPIRGLVEVAQKKKDFKVLIERLDQLLELSPDSLHERIIRGHLYAKMYGSASHLRDQLDTFLDLAERQPLDITTAKRLQLAIQYAATGSQLTLKLLRLRSLIEEQSGAQPANNLPYRVLLAEIVLALGDYGEFIQLVSELGKLLPKRRKILSLSRIAEKCRDQSFPDFQAPKVFGIGLSRTATSSLNAALNELGLHSIHWANPHTQNLISQEDFLLFDAFSDISVSYQFEQLYHTFPNARFIYTKRSAESWIKSISFHYQNNRGVNHPSQLALPSATQRFNFAAGHIEMNLYGRCKSWQEAFEVFDERVQRFFEDKPDSQFLQLRICDGEGWEKLCAFLDKPIPAKPFPNTNQSPR